MRTEKYKTLYYRAFNSITELMEHAQEIQQELEEMYLDLEERFVWPEEEEGNEEENKDKK